MENVTDYKTLALALCEIYSPASKTQIADRIGISQKTIYNMIYGAPVGVYTQKKLIPFVKKEFGYQIKNVEGGIRLQRIALTGHSDLLELPKTNFYKNYIEIMMDENASIKEENTKLKDIIAKLEKSLD